MTWKKSKFLKIALLLWAAIPTAAYGLDCSHKPPCPTGTVAQESVSCDVCCVEGLVITSPTDAFCCPPGYRPSPDNYACLREGAFLKSDGSCYVMAETDQCCPTGSHLVNKYECCPDGYTLATDNDMCCTQRADGKCCPEKFVYNIDIGGRCIPPKPVGVQVR